MGQNGAGGRQSPGENKGRCLAVTYRAIGCWAASGHTLPYDLITPPFKVLWRRAHLVQNSVYTPWPGVHGLRDLARLTWAALSPPPTPNALLKYPTV